MENREVYSVCYDHRKVEQACGSAAGWLLLINALAGHGILDYGTSPRYGWLSPAGKALHEYVTNRTLGHLIRQTEAGDDYAHCYPDRCNCGDGADCTKQNPFWRKER